MSNGYVELWRTNLGSIDPESIKDAHQLPIAGNRIKDQQQSYFQCQRSSPYLKISQYKDGIKDSKKTDERVEKRDKVVQ